MKRSIYKKSTASIILNGEEPNDFSLGSGPRQEYSPLLFNPALEGIQGNYERKTKNKTTSRLERKK